MKGKQAVLTVVNPDTHNPQEPEIDVRGARINDCKATVLAAAEIHARNTLYQPNAVQSSTDSNVRTASPMIYRFAPASVTRLDLELA